MDRSEGPKANELPRAKVRGRSVLLCLRRSSSPPPPLSLSPSSPLLPLPLPSPRQTVPGLPEFVAPIAARLAAAIRREV